ncbi:hypothetical protein SKAU_G00330300 [Synaphobranchus kaupii]|uniref:Ig-like domain-containing protein n=1 Tax=Synaphobranchus kaupii TaxID=118154 RepID=A0A9Q1EQJ6_SYNKA|nr:hypothetical protein SKAU_G00330300 [Synaphobranchus kaupii]
MFVFVFVLLFLQTTGTTAFEVSTSTPVVNVPEGQGADLKCSYTADIGAPRIEWKFKNLQSSQGLVVYDGVPTAGYAGRVELYKGGLRFNKVTRADTGDYNCEVSSVQNFGEATIKLVVQVPPSVPIKFPAYKNSTFTIDPKTGDLVFPHISKLDAGEYYCTASNGVGPPQSCAPVRLAVNDMNTGGIVAGVIVALLALALLAFGLWYAHRKGYFPKKSESKPRALYQPPSDYVDEEDGEFRQKSSFVV